MKKKIFACLLTLTILTMLIPASGLAVTPYDLMVDINGYSDVDLLVYGNSYVYDSDPSTPEEVIIICAVGTTLTISDLNIQLSGPEYPSPILFTGGSNTLILEDGSQSFLLGGYNFPAIFVEGGTSLTIEGDYAELIAIGGMYASGIGAAGVAGFDPAGSIVPAGDLQMDTFSGVAVSIPEPLWDGSCGNITVNGGYIVAIASQYHDILAEPVGEITLSGITISGIGPEPNSGAAGIGGASGGTIGKITINDGIVFALGAAGGAGIGTGPSAGDADLQIEINGGEINAVGVDYGAGIGAGNYGDFEYIRITGGNVYAISGLDMDPMDENETGAGIGYGLYDGSVIEILGMTTQVTVPIATPTPVIPGQITISGGVVYAGTDGVNSHDVGSAVGCSVDPFVTISGSAQVFMENDRFPESLIADVHNYEPGVLLENDLYLAMEVYEIDCPEFYEDADTGFFILPEHAGKMTGSITGTVLDFEGNPLDLYELELYSIPRSTVTAPDGTFTFSDVPFTDHYLFLYDEFGNLIASFKIEFQHGTATSSLINNNSNFASVVFTDGTYNIDFSIMVNEGEDDFDITGIVFTEIVNPRTGDADYMVYLYGVLIAAVLALITGVFIKKRSRA